MLNYAQCSYSKRKLVKYVKKERLFRQNMIKFMRMMDKCLTRFDYIKTVSFKF